MGQRLQKEDVKVWSERPTMGQFIHDRVAHRRLKYSRLCPMSWGGGGDWLRTHYSMYWDISHTPFIDPIRKVDHAWRLGEARTQWDKLYGPREAPVWKERHYLQEGYNAEDKISEYAVECDQYGELRPGTGRRYVGETDADYDNPLPESRSGYTTQVYPIGSSDFTTWVYGMDKDGKPLAEKR